jgi:hypothetical protein
VTRLQAITRLALAAVAVWLIYVIALIIITR